MFKLGGKKLFVLCLLIKNVSAIAPIIPMKIGNSTCQIASATLGTLFLCCVRVVNQNTAAACVLLFLRNVTCASHAPYNIHTT